MLPTTSASSGSGITILIRFTLPTPAHNLLLIQVFISTFFTGTPPIMDPDEMAENIEAARHYKEDEANRTRGGFQPGGLDPPGGSQQPRNRTTPSFCPTANQQEVQQPRNRFLPSGPDPGVSGPLTQPPSGFSSLSAQAIRQMVPQLAHMPDDYLVAQPCDAIFRLCREEKLAAAAAESTKAAKGLEIRLHANAKKAKDCPIFLDGWDNRFNTLHPAPFLPGGGVPVTQLWLEARKLWGQDGTEPIGTFDVETVACSGCVTPRGWELLHKPGSPEISIKMFTISNVAHSATGSRTISLTGQDGLVISESWKELTDMADLKLAMRNLLLAAHLAVPWNFSFQVLDGFIQSKKYFESELSGLKKATILSSFLDYCLQKNAALWVQESVFLDSPKLAALWDSWWISREMGARADPAADNNKQQNKNKNKQGAQNGNNSGNNNGNGANKGGQKSHQNFQAQQAQKPLFAPPNVDNLCRRYNEKRCPNHFADCSLRLNNQQLIKLWHLCNYMVKKDGKNTAELCKEKHSRLDHK